MIQYGLRYNTDLFIVFTDFPTPPACMDGDSRLYNNYTNMLNRDYEYVTELNGVLEICYNGTYRGVCYGNTYDEQEVAETVCSSLGYTGSMCCILCTH